MRRLARARTWILVGLWVSLTQMSSPALLGIFASSHEVALHCDGGRVTLLLRHRDAADHDVQPPAAPHRHAPADRLVLPAPHGEGHGADHVVALSEAERASLQATSLGGIRHVLLATTLPAPRPSVRGTLWASLPSPGPAPPVPVRNTPLLI